eukprot:13786047-Alexandrium_andersonii.AAC.1
MLDGPQHWHLADGLPMAPPRRPGKRSAPLRPLRPRRLRRTLSGTEPWEAICSTRRACAAASPPPCAAGPPPQPRGGRPDP